MALSPLRFGSKSQKGGQERRVERGAMEEIDVRVKEPKDWVAATKEAVFNTLFVILRES